MHPLYCIIILAALLRRLCDLEACIASGRRDASEYRSAQAELARLAQQRK